MKDAFISLFKPVEFVVLILRFNLYGSTVQCFSDAWFSYRVNAGFVLRPRMLRYVQDTIRPTDS